MIGATELLLISGMVLLIFGGKKLPELMKGMGKGVRSFKEGMNGSPDEGENHNTEDENQHQEVECPTNNSQNDTDGENAN